jgi:cytochrome c oxidase assembly protein subunit 15
MSSAVAPIPTRVRTARVRALPRYAAAALGFMVLVILWGAVVRATGSGGGCGSNWPLCNGDYFPHHPRLATVIEFTHRSTSGVCTFLLIALGVLTFRVTPQRHRARTAVLWAGFLLVTEALLGAMLVLKHWVEANVSTGRVIAQCVHLTNTMLFMAALALTAWFLTDRVQIASRREGHRPMALLAIVSTLLVAATGSLAALADTLFPSPNLAAAFAADAAAASPALIRMRWLHPAAAVLSVVFVLLLVRVEGLRHPIARIVVAMLALLFVLGVGDVLLLAPIWMQVLHLLSADIYWIALVLLASDVFWPPTWTTHVPSLPV